MDNLTFVGMVQSGSRISSAAEKVVTVPNAREPQNASETRSSLGLVNYCGQFIPDQATIFEPLRRLTKPGIFVFGSEQKEASREFKRHCQEQRLRYFDNNVLMQVVAAASPVCLGAVVTQMVGELLVTQDRKKWRYQGVKRYRGPKM
ncbi:uncharacterized protein LOC141894979 [Acropora palmata]|uniref:uncharacterized protein LOC141894979 n=1 Tax=Acropora palmata TaxID=6131 RepID=UPI003DA16629